MAATMAMPARRPALGELSESRFNYNAHCKPVKNGMLLYTYSILHILLSNSHFHASRLTQPYSRLCQGPVFMPLQGPILGLQLLIQDQAIL